MELRAGSVPLRVPSTHPSYLLAWKGHRGRCLGPALKHTALCHFFSGNLQVKMSFLSPQLSISLLCSFSPTRWSVRFMWETSPHPGAGDETDGDGEEGPPLPAAGAAGRAGRGAWLGCGRDEGSGQKGDAGAATGSAGRGGGGSHPAKTLTSHLNRHQTYCGPSRPPHLFRTPAFSSSPPRPAKLPEQVGYALKPHALPICLSSCSLCGLLSASDSCPKPLSLGSPNLPPSVAKSTGP